jgi:hypothetical protein
MGKWGYRVAKKLVIFILGIKGRGFIIYNAAFALQEFSVLYYPQFNFGHGVNWVPNIGKFDHFVVSATYSCGCKHNFRPPMQQI